MDAGLPRIDHLVVLMLENRAFDHLLGALTLEDGRTDVDGLTPGLAHAYDGVTSPVHHRPATALRPDQDPPHDGAAVAEPLADGLALSWDQRKRGGLAFSAGQEVPPNSLIR